MKNILFFKKYAKTRVLDSKTHILVSKTYLKNKLRKKFIDTFNPACKVGFQNDVSLATLAAIWTPLAAIGIFPVALIPNIFKLMM